MEIGLMFILDSIGKKAFGNMTELKFEEFRKMKTSHNTGYSYMPAGQPTANSLQAYALGEFAGTSFSQPL